MMVYRKDTWERITGIYHCALLGITIDLVAILGPAGDTIQI